MDLTKEQIEEMIARVTEEGKKEGLRIQKELSGKFATKDDIVDAVAKVAERIPSSTDTSKLATKAELKTLGETLTTSQETEIKKVNEDLKKVIEKVMPNAPKSGFWLFD